MHRDYLFIVSAPDSARIFFAAGKGHGSGNTERREYNSAFHGERSNGNGHGTTAAGRFRMMRWIPGERVPIPVREMEMKDKGGERAAVFREDAIVLHVPGIISCIGLHAIAKDRT